MSGQQTRTRRTMGPRLLRMDICIAGARLYNSPSWWLLLFSLTMLHKSHGSFEGRALKFEKCVAVINHHYFRIKYQISLPSYARCCCLVFDRKESDAVTFRLTIFTDCSQMRYISIFHYSYLSRTFFWCKAELVAACNLCFHSFASL